MKKKHRKEILMGIGILIAVSAAVLSATHAISPDVMAIFVVSCLACLWIIHRLP